MSDRPERSCCHLICVILNPECFYSLLICVTLKPECFYCLLIYVTSTPECFVALLAGARSIDWPIDGPRLGTWWLVLPRSLSEVIPGSLYKIIHQIVPSASVNSVFMLL